MDPASQEDSLTAALRQIAPPDHLCAICETVEEQQALAMRFLRLGLERGEKCVYLAGAGGADAACAAMAAHGIDVEASRARSALRVETSQAYLDRGTFHPQRMLAFWEEAAREARRQGFSAARFVGATAWLAQGAPGVEHWLEYESRLTESLLDCNCSILCPYDRRLSPPAVLRDAIRTHPLVVYRGRVCRNLYHAPAAELLGAQAAEREVDRLLEHVLQRELVDDNLQAREAYLHHILESVTDNFFALSRDWRFTYLNRHAASQMRRLGKDPAALVGRVLWDEFAPVPNAPALRRVMYERVPVTDEIYYDPLGEWLENHIYPSRDGGLICFQRYVTGRKRDEERLRRSAALLDVGQEITRTGSWSWNPSTEELFWSPEHFRIFGFEVSAEAPAVARALARLHPDDRPVWEAAFTSAVADKASFDVQGRVVHPDGSLRHVRSIGRPVLDADGSVREYVGTIMDTTDQKRAQEDLMASERRFRQLAEAIPHHVWTLHPDGAVGYHNRQLADYTGLAANELMQGGWAALHPDDAQRVGSAWRHALATGTPFELEQRLRARDGRYRRFLCRAVPVRDAPGRVLEWFATNTDIEARRQAEEEMNRARTELAYVNRALTMGELAASIAHELNQPLAAVVTHANACEHWLAAPTPNIAETVGAMRRISRDANRASEVIARIRGLLTRRPPQRTQLRVEEVIRDVSLLVERELSAQNVQSRFSAAEGLPLILADRVQLQQVVLNLVINAIEAMGGVERARKLEVHAGPYGERGVLIRVSDSGPGVPARFADKVFDAFFSTKREGMGMGLAISRSIVEAHGGRLWGRNNEFGGATFQFTLHAPA